MNPHKKLEKNAISLARSVDGQAIQLIPSAVTINTEDYSSLVSAQSLTLNPDTNIVEVNAFNQPVVIKFNGTATATSYDRMCQPGGTIHIIVPAGVTTMSFIEYFSGAKAAVLEYDQIV